MTSEWVAKNFDRVLNPDDCGPEFEQNTRELASSNYRTHAVRKNILMSLMFLDEICLKDSLVFMKRMCHSAHINGNVYCCKAERLRGPAGR